MREKEIERGRRRRQRGGAEVLEAGDGDAPASGIEVMELVLLDDGRLERKGAVLLEVADGSTGMARGVSCARSG